MGDENAGKAVNTEGLLRTGKTSAVFKTPCLPQIVMMPKAPTMTGSPIGTAINLIIQIRPGKSCLRESASATGRPRTIERTVDNVA